ncbi:hypothetical protein ACWCPF_38325 [Streptomyces sp. NPDC001858]
MEDKTAQPGMSAEAKADMWKAMYFRAQAGMERYMVSNYGYGAIDEWIDFSAEATAKQSDRYKTEGALPFTENLSRILGDCWGSEVTVRQKSAERSVVDIDDCGILSYRRGAARLGIELTFDDPCREYCTKLQSAIAAKQNLSSSCTLKSGGCSWTFTRNEEEG